MKKHLLIAGLLCVTTITPAAAVTKCVKLTSSTTCSNSSHSGSNWSVTCDGVPVEGVGFCVSQVGNAIGAAATAVTVSLSSDDNKYCWCKMVSPAVSRWIYATTFSSRCADNCTNYCANVAKSNTSFKSAMFRNLSD